MSARERFIQEMEPAQATSVLQSRKMEGQSHLSSFTSDKELHELEFALLSALFSRFGFSLSEQRCIFYNTICIFCNTICLNYVICFFLLKGVTIKRLPHISRETLKPS